MAVNETFKTQIQAGKLKEALISVMSEAIELKITTWIAPKEESLLPASSKTETGHYLKTRLNVLDGEIENEIGHQFIVQNAYQDFQKFHLEQVKGGHSLVQNNLENIQRMFSLLTESLSESSESN